MALGGGGEGFCACGAQKGAVVLCKVRMLQIIFFHCAKTAHFSLIHFEIDSTFLLHLQCRESISQHVAVSRAAGSYDCYMPTHLLQGKKNFHVLFKVKKLIRNCLPLPHTGHNDALLLLLLLSH